MVAGRVSYGKLRVDLWIAGTADKEGNGGYCARLCSLLNEKELIKTIGGYGKNATVTRMNLIALREGLRAIKSPSFIHIYTYIPSISAGLHKNMYAWEKNNWQTAKNKLVKHADLWQEIIELIRFKSLAYKVHYRQQDLDPNPNNRLYVIQKTSNYVLKAKQDVYDVAMPV